MSRSSQKQRDCFNIERTIYINGKLIVLPLPTIWSWVALIMGPINYIDVKDPSIYWETKTTVSTTYINTYAFVVGQHILFYLLEANHS